MTEAPKKLPMRVYFVLILFLVALLDPRSTVGLDLNNIVFKSITGETISIPIKEYNIIKFIGDNIVFYSEEYPNLYREFDINLFRHISFSNEITTDTNSKLCESEELAYNSTNNTIILFSPFTEEYYLKIYATTGEELINIRFNSNVPILLPHFKSGIYIAVANRNTVIKHLKFYTK